MDKRILSLLIFTALLSAGAVFFFIMKPAVPKKKTDSAKSADSSLYTRQDTQLNTGPSAPVSVSAASVNESSTDNVPGYDGGCLVMPRTAPAVKIDGAVSIPANQTLQTINQIQEINQRNRER